MWLPSESQQATRDSFERDYQNAADAYERWRVFVRALDHIDNLRELEEHRKRNR